MILRSLQDNFSKHFLHMYFLLLFCDISTFFFSNLILESSRSSPKNFLSKSSYSQIIPLVPCLFFFFLLWPFSSKISSYFYFSFFWNIVNLLLFEIFWVSLIFWTCEVFQWISGFCLVHIMNVRKIFLLSSFIFLAVSFVSVLSCFPFTFLSSSWMTQPLPL